MRVKRFNSPEEFIQYRNKIVHRLNARNKNFPKESKRDKTYYEIRLEEIDMQYPEFYGIGKVIIKKGS